ncbi:amino acid transporter AVT1I-like isoform X2 [Syzygium oleosum]|uniref:amino acid transporter AVT1I-like isoform X2 n=1 Tax=Syzygium oleosum TaxID=219896 RepID=UPI0024BA750A|nr:amino acid transporter AVT1I-like isoform X2 [Syzygium oleosum]
METQQHEGSSPPQAKGTTFLRTCFNGINTLSAILFWYTGLLLQRCMIANQLIKTYPDIGELAFGHKGRALISIFMYLELYLVAVEFLILEGDNLDKLFPNHGFKLGHLTIGGKQGFVLLATLVVLPTTWLRSLGALAYISAGGILASIILVLCVLWVGAIDGVGFDEEGTLLNWSGIPTAISLFAFCYGGHAVFPTLSNSMKDRSQFSKVLLVCFLTCTVTYGSMAVLGYTMYGEHLKSQVTLNLPVRKMSSKIAIYTTLINPLTKYALIINPIATALEETCPLRNSRPVSILLRTVIVVSTVIMALVIPFFGYVMAFIGSFLSVTMSVLLPCFCYLKINRGSKKKKSRIEVGVIVGIILVGFFIGVVGTYVSLKQIIDHLRK